MSETYLYDDDDDFVEDELGWGMTFRGSGRDPVARADDRPTLAGVLADHLGEEVQVLDVVEETWPAYDHVNMQTTCPGSISPAVPRERYVALDVVADQPGAADAIAADIRRLALEHNVVRGQVISFDHDMFGEGSTALHFHPRSTITADDVVLPEAALQAIDRQVVGVARHRDRLLAARQHLKRGLLLYGPPGVGKTHTVRYLTSQLSGVTIIQLSGNALAMIGTACSVARTLQPAMIVVEDVDLIAEDRGDYPGRHPLLFQLLNEMDGLAEDADVVFLLTTNRADLLARLESVLERTEGVTASFLKELLRRAALIAVADSDAVGEAPLEVSADHLDTALDELLDTRNAMTRVLLGGGREAS
jgi:hypothetical protein